VLGRGQHRNGHWARRGYNEKALSGEKGRPYKDDVEAREGTAFTGEGSAKGKTPPLGRIKIRSAVGPIPQLGGLKYTYWHKMARSSGDLRLCVRRGIGASY